MLFCFLFFFFRFQMMMTTFNICVRITPILVDCALPTALAPLVAEVRILTNSVAFVIDIRSCFSPFIRPRPPRPFIQSNFRFFHRWRLLIWTLVSRVYIYLRALRVAAAEERRRRNERHIIRPVWNWVEKKFNKLVATVEYYFTSIFLCVLSPCLW